MKWAQDDLEVDDGQAGEDAVAMRVNINGLHPEDHQAPRPPEVTVSPEQPERPRPFDRRRRSSRPGAWRARWASTPISPSARASCTTSAKRVPANPKAACAIISADFIRAASARTLIVVNAVAAHHEEVKPEGAVYAGLVILADTISRDAAGRPGGVDAELHSAARPPWRSLALLPDWVQQAFAIQAGREIRSGRRSPQHVTDDQARGSIAKEPAPGRIEAELQYPEHSSRSRSHPGEPQFTEDLASLASSP